jgi:hypothetical protein
MRSWAIPLCFVLAACSSSVIELPAINAPESAKAVEGAKRAATEEKLIGPLEISAVREAHPLSLPRVISYA